MIIRKWRSYLLLLMMFTKAVCSDVTSQSIRINPWQQWTFTGIAQTEEGKIYYYYFIFQQKGKDRKVDVLVLTEQYKEVIRYHKISEKSPMRTPKPNAWKLGRTFFRYNPITKSWVFGIKTKQAKGFNFKADLRPMDGDLGVRQSITEGLVVEMNQFQQLNGHLFFAQAQQEIFLSAQRGWLRYIEGEEPPNKLMALLCTQDNGAGLYSLQYDSPKASKAAIVGLRDAKGKREQVSQFLTVDSQDEETWKLSIVKPRTNWTLTAITRFVTTPFETFVLTDQQDEKPTLCFYQRGF